MNSKKTIWSGITSALASVFAVFGVISCCGMPILASILATVGVGASQLSFFAKYRGYFLLFAIIALIYGFYQAYFRKKSDCCCAAKEAEANADDKTQKNSIWPKICLWIGTALTIAALFIGKPGHTGTDASECCPSENVQPSQSGCCGTTEDDEIEIEFENKSSATSCCGTQEAAEQNNDCCTQN